MSTAEVVVVDVPEEGVSVGRCPPEFPKLHAVLHGGRGARCGSGAAASASAALLLMSGLLGVDRGHSSVPTFSEARTSAGQVQSATDGSIM